MLPLLLAGLRLGLVGVSCRSHGAWRWRSATPTRCLLSRAREP